MNKELNEVQKYLDKKLAEDKRLEPKSIKKEKKSRKGLIISIVALLLAVAATITGIMGLKKKKDKPENVPQTSITVNVDDLGKEEEIKEETENKQYGEVTGDIKKEELVEKDDVIWKDQEAADKSEEVGKVEIDLQGGNLTVDSQGDVVETTPSYEVKDESGKVVDQGTNDTGIPEGYAWDSVLNKIVPVEEVGKYVYVDATYYGPNGEIVFEKGEIVLKETLTKMKEQLTTTKPEVTTQVTIVEKPQETTTQTPEQTTTQAPEVTYPNEKINQDGTFTITYEIDGEVTSVTYMDKATYELWLLDENSSENYGMYKGIIYPIEVIEQMSRQNKR